MECTNTRTELKIIDTFRLGKEGEKPRPLKISFQTTEMANSVLKKAAKLSELKDVGINVYVKPDKTKSEQNEFHRLGEKKKSLLLEYPTTEDNLPRVTLKKGLLMVDGVEVDKYQPVQTLF